MTDPLGTINRLVAATNAHDVNAVVECFAEKYVNQTPAHPARGFTGRDQVRRNWTTIFAAVPDIRADVLAASIDGNTVWSEWEMTGTRLDGAAHHLRGVIVFDVAQGEATAARFYLEPVDTGSAGIDEAVQMHVGTQP